MNTIYDKLTQLDFIIIAIYLIVLLTIGYVVSFKQNKKDETLFLANNSLNWYNIGFNMWRGIAIGDIIILLSNANVVLINYQVQNDQNNN